MWSIIEAAGWPIWTIILASVISLAIIFERLFSLRASLIVPDGLLAQTVTEYRRVGASADLLQLLNNHSPLGKLFAAGLRNVSVSREVMKDAIEDEGRV
ncbi:MotA/TolQ/ExbB proton channel family protein, partial [Pseudomonas sp. MWU12-2115]